MARQEINGLKQEMEFLDVQRTKRRRLAPERGPTERRTFCRRFSLRLSSVACSIFSFHRLKKYDGSV